MKLKFIITILFSCFITAAIAQPAKTGNGYVQVTQVSRTKDADENITYAINAIWKQNATPENIFFRAEDVWQGCLVEKDGVEMSPEKIKKGDRITFRSVSGGKYAMPAQLKKLPTPSLFFQVDKRWYYMPVRNIATTSGRGK